MKPGCTARSRIRAARGHAIIVALGLVIGLLVIVAAAASVVMQQFKQTKTERSNERALNLAEAGANAYLNMLARGVPANTVANYGLIPPKFVAAAADVIAYDTANGMPAGTSTGVMPIATFKTEIQNVASTKVPHSNLIYYPAGQTNQCYFAYETPSSSNTKIVVAFGWCSGVVRRVQVTGIQKSAFDIGGLYGLNPNDALDLKNIIINGAWGAEGTVNANGATNFNGGPSILAGLGVTNNPNTSGFPNLIKYANSLDLPTADQSANAWALSRFTATTNLGVEYFRTNNNNGTGIRIIVKNKATGALRELDDPTKPYNVVPNTASGTAMVLDATAASALAAGAGMVTTAGPNQEQYVGLRIYPGSYYFTQVTGNGNIYMRTYTDAVGARPAADPLAIVKNYNGTVSDPPNPNSGESGDPNIRVWIGGAPVATTSLNGFTTEDPTYSTRFRLYTANRGSGGTSVAIKQNTISVSVLAYNQDVNGYYGTVDIATQSTINGSLIAWNISDHGNSVINGPVSVDTVGSQEAISFHVTTWKELP